MTALFQYSLAVSIPLIVLWAIYRFALAFEKSFRLNRVVILGIYVVSLFLWPAMIKCGTTAQAVLVLSGGMSTVDTIDVYHILSMLTSVWLAGVIVGLCISIREMWRIRIIIRKCVRRSTGEHVVYVASDNNISPFSFGNIIVMSESDYLDNRDHIILHEGGHIRSLHSLDMIVAQAVTLLCWYNPAAWLLRNELKSVHEYQADGFVLEREVDAKEYQMLLLRKAVGPDFPWLTHHLAHTRLRRRISMMNRRDKRVSIAGRLKYMLLPAGIAIGIGVLSAQSISYVIAPRREVVAPPFRSPLPEETEIFVDGQHVDRDRLNDIPADNIKSITVNKVDNRIDVATGN